MRKIDKKTEKQLIKKMTKKERYKFEKMQEDEKKEFINSLFTVAVTQDFESEFQND